MNFNLPKNYEIYIDKYFLRAKEILIKENLNPVVKAQVFIRNANCRAHGINEAIAILTKYSNSKNLKVYAVPEGSLFEYGERLMIIEAPIQDIIDLETMYLGVISAETTLQNGEKDIDLKQIEENMKKIVDLIAPRPVSYFGARHWRYDRDWDIARACKKAGALNCSTDVGAQSFPPPFDKGIGTIPHALEAIYHWQYGIESAVSGATMAFDAHIPTIVPRIALVDYANREVLDSIIVTNMVGLKREVDAIRVDTCGENAMQGIVALASYRKGVSVDGVYILRKVLPEKVKIILSSGFGNPNKVRGFLDTEKILGMKLFDALGVGGVFKSRMATMDIIEVEGKEIHKVGRNLMKDDKLVRVL